ncbi:MAG: hypothetical protein JWO45_106 [Spartobacteria bacterium]|nr:hypothetical protein [Spartobacteria bacterium]
MAWRIHESVVRGELDNRERDHVRGTIWLVGRHAPIALDLSGNCTRDLAGCVVRFENPAAVAADSERTNLAAQQCGPAGEITASRKTRVFDVPLEEALELTRGGKSPPEHTANALYIEWFSEADGRVVIESADYTLNVSAPSWRLSTEDEAKQIATTHEALRTWLERMDENRIEEAPSFNPDEERPVDEFGYEKFMRESDARTDKYMELLEKYEGHPDCEKIVAREMGWEWLEEALEADERGALPPSEEFETPPLVPNPATEGIDWIRDENGHIHHPLTKRAFHGAMAMWHFCDDHDLLGDAGDADLREMIFEFQTAGAKLAGALNSLAYDDDDSSRDAGFVVAALKRALNYIHKSIAAAEKVAPKNLIPAERLEAFRGNLFDIREEVLALMQRFREKKF